MSTVGRPYDALLVDFGGTLDADGIPWAVRFHAAYWAAGGREPLASFETWFRTSDQALAAEPGIARAGFRALVARQAEWLARALPDGDRIRWTDVAAHFCRATCVVVERNRPVLQALARHYRIAVVSNFCGNLEPCLEELGLRAWVTVALDSAAVGVAKPDPGIWRLALAELGVRPARALVVGDNPEADIRPAAQLGLATCWIAPPDRPAPAGLAPTFRIARFPELLSVVDRCTD